MSENEADSKVEAAGKDESGGAPTRKAGGPLITKEQAIAAAILAVTFIASIVISNASGNVAEQQSTVESE